MMVKIILKSLVQTLGFALLFLLLQFLWDGFSTNTLDSVMADAQRQLFMLLFIFITMILQNIIIQQQKGKMERDKRKRTVFK